jgi:GT2 family glycosyltransferase
MYRESYIKRLIADFPHNAHRPQYGRPYRISYNHKYINIYSLITALRFAAIKFVGCKLGQNKVSHLRILGQQNEGL